LSFVDGVLGAKRSGVNRRLLWGEPSGAEDSEIARALLARERGAQRAAWERFSPLVRRIVRRFMGPGCDTEDAVQDAFVCLFEKVPTLREPAAIRAFVMAITLRTARYHARRRRARGFVGLPDGDAHPALRVVQGNLEPRFALERFYRILDRVNDRDRAAFVLRYIEGLELSEVARALGTSPPTARRRFTRAYGRIALLARRDPLLIEYLATKRSTRSVRPAAGPS
jgi:RNA polymerase sigma-70 factor (ECF subfamily)